MTKKENKCSQTPVAASFGLQGAPTLVVRARHRSMMTVTELKCDAREFGLTRPVPPEDAYFVALQLGPSHDQDLWIDGRHVRYENFVAGTTTIHDLRRGPVAYMKDPFHLLVFHLPRQLFNSFTEETGAPHIEQLHYRPGVGIDDPIARRLMSCFQPALERPGEIPPIFTDYVALALAGHIATTYGQMRAPRRLCRGGLAPWQERRAKELLRANLDGGVTLEQIAAECRLSVGHFARAFRQTMGVAPHRWLVKQRVEQAIALLQKPTLRLIDVALACGFADQSHFTRVFAKTMGVSPGAWRRLHASGADLDADEVPCATPSVESFT